MAVRARGQITLVLVEDGNGITDVSVLYYLSTSSTSQTGGSWSATPPAWVDGRYMWSKTVTVFADGTSSETKPVCITGGKGASGTGITSITTQFYLSTSKTAQTGGSWVTTQPVWVSGKYLWTRSKIVYKNPTSTVYTAPVCDSSWEAVNDMEVKITDAYTVLVDSTARDITNSVERLENKVRGDDPDSIESRLQAALTQITEAAIVSTVSSEYYKKTETDGKYATKENLETKIEQLKDRVTITLKEMSGFNFLYNSSGWNATSFWTTTGSVTGIRNNDTTDNTVSGSAFYLESGTMKQEVRLTPGNKYTISCKMKKYMSSCSMKVTQNGISETVFSFTSSYTDEKWHSYELPFTCTASTVSIEISSSAKHLTIADIMLNDGEIEKTWTSNNNEIYTSGVKIDKTGLEVTQSNTDTKTIIDASEFAVIYTKTGKKVVRVNKDTTILQKVVAEDDLMVGTVKMIKRDNGLDFAIIEE